MNIQQKVKRQKPGQKRDTRPTIGVLTNWLGGLYQTQWLGAVDAAHAHEVNLICFPGRELNRPDNFYRQANAIFDLAGPEQLDGLVIWTTTLQVFIGRQKMEAFCQRYHPLPIVSVEQEMTGFPSLLMDNKQGMRTIINHLIEAHGYRRIAFIRGPANHPGAQERYQSYKETLAEHGLPFDPALVSPHPSFWRPEEAAVLTHRLLDEHFSRTPSIGEEHTQGIEAIVAANDYLALGVLSALQTRNILVPDQIAVTGFDNNVYVDLFDVGMDPAGNDPVLADETRPVNINTTTLPLTTIQPPFYELGWQAVETVLAQIRGEEVPESVIIPTKLIIRRSCGCFSQAVQQIASEPIKIVPPRESVAQTFPDTLTTQREALIAALQQDVKQAPVAPASDWAERLVTAFIEEIHGEHTNSFLATLDELMRASVRNHENPEQWWQILFALRQQTMPHLTNDEALQRGETMWQQGQMLMSEMLEQFYVYQQLQAEKRNEVVRDIGQRLITTFHVDQLAEILSEELPKLRIRSCYLSLYESSHSSSRNGAQARPDVGKEVYPTARSRSILVYENREQVDLVTDTTSFSSRQLVPGERLRRKQPYSMVVEPLYFRDWQLGFVLFEMGIRDGWVYETLRGQLSSALQGALLVEREKEALAEVENAKQKVEVALTDVLEAQKQTHKLATELATVAEVSIAASTILETNQLLQTVVDLTKIRFELYHTHIYLLHTLPSTAEKEENVLVLAAGAGERGRQMVAAGWHISLATEQSLVARAARQHKGVIVNDVRQTPDFLPNPLLPDTRSEMAVPMIAGDKVVGVLDVQSEQVNHFTEEDLHIQTTLAAQVAVAVENTRLYDRARQEIAERQQAQAEREKLIGELQEALAKIKTLRGLIPICASCKKIRDDQGYWTQLEVYIRDHSEAEFSHSICSDCMQKLYSDFFDDE